MNEKAPLNTAINVAERGNTGMVPTRMGDLVHSSGRYSDATSPGEDKDRTFNRTDQGQEATMEREFCTENEMKDDLIAVVGSAPNALLDLYSLIESTGRFCDIMAIGIDAVRMIEGTPIYVATNHIEDIPGIKAILAEKQGWSSIISYKQAPGVDIVEPYAPIIERSGSSSMTGTLAAIRLGYKKIVLCGIPLTGNAPEGNPYEAFRLGWEDKKDELTGKVKSLSGWTKDLLGNPTWEWLNE